MSGASPSGKRRAKASAGRAPANRRASSRPTGKRPRRPRTFKQRLGWAAKWTVLVGLVLCLIGVGTFAVAYSRTEIPDPNEDFQTQTTFVYYADGKDELGRFAEQNRESIPLAEMPDTIKNAVVAAENRSFWTDRGLDPKGILRAAFSNARGNATQGASTITQQYVKILYLSQERTYTRKAKEALLSLKLHRTETKEQILEGYLNTIYFGRGAYGIQAAARAFFNVPAKDLNLKQSAALASIINNPSQFDPANGKDNRAALKERYDYTLSGMADLGYATPEEVAAAQKRLPKFPPIEAENSLGGQTGHALALVKGELEALGFTDEQIRGQGLRVTTTLTKKAMDAAEQGVLEERPEGFSDKQLHVGVASVEVGTGALRGFYAGQDYVQSQINWAVAGGMVGSTMKPFTLAAALEAGFSLKDTFEGNSPMEFPGGLEVNNQGEGLGSDFGSAVDALTALEKSINTAFVDMSDSIPEGARAVWRTARAAGIPPAEPDPKFPGIPRRSNADFNPENFLLTLGNSVISPINMANAYATIANGGERANVHVVDKVVGRDGTVLYEHKDRTTRAIEEDVAADVSYALQETVTDGTASPALEIGRPAAAKTGTATNAKDQVSSAWFAGYTPQLATAVMYVRGKGTEGLDGWLPSYFGSGYPGSTWANVMERAMEGMEVEEFPPPAWVDGEAPTEGHAPLPPPPPPAPEPPEPEEKPEKKQKPEKKPEKKPEPAPEPTPTLPVPEQPGNGNGNGNGGGGESPSPSPEPEPTIVPTATRPAWRD